jgi:hypothetical protein
VEFCGDYDTWTVVDSSFFMVTVVDAISGEEDASPASAEESRPGLQTREPAGLFIDP